MTKYIIRRMIQAIPVLIGITIVVYVILQLAPGGPQAKFANNPRMTNEQKAAFMKSWGLDQPIPIQYCRWMGICDANGEGFDFLGPTGWPNFLPTAISGATNGILHGDLGYSITSGEKVNDTIVRAALPTFILATAALIIWIGIAIVIGVYSAIKRYSLFDNVSTVFAYVGFAIPTFWLGIMLVYIFGTSRILPVSGMVDIRVSPAFGNDAYWVYFGQHPLDAILDVGKHLILPVVTLVVVTTVDDVVVTVVVLVVVPERLRYRATANCVEAPTPLKPATTMPPFDWIAIAIATSSLSPSVVVTMPLVPKPLSGVPPVS